jgi:hypothetical protein
MDDGARPPFYPALLILAGIHPPRVQLIQSVLGTFTTGLVFGLVWRFTRRAGWAIAAGLVQALSPDALAFEAYLVTEAPATFLLTVIAALLVAVRSRPTPMRAATLGVMVALSALNKTFHLFLVPFSLVVILWPRRAHGAQSRSPAAALAAFVLPVGLMVGGWCLWEWHAHGMFTPSTQTGFRLSQHVGNEMERAPDRYAVLRDIYLAHRARVIAETGSHVNTIWAAQHDMEVATGFTYAQLSRQVWAMSLAVARADPPNYVRSVARAWALSWSRPMVVSARFAHDPAVGARLVRTGKVVRPFFLLINALFLAFAAALLWPPLRVRLSPDGDLAVLAALVVTGVTVAAIGELSDNGKFAAPFMPAVLVCVTAALAGRRRPAR